MNPILGAALYGLGKGVVIKSKDHQQDFARAVVTGPIVEEAIFRAGLGALKMGGAVGAFAFAVDHLDHPLATPGETAVRFADTFAGGLIYSEAYAQFGFLGAVAAHIAHNFAVYVSSRAQASVPTPAPTMGSYRRSRRSRNKRG